MTQNSIEKDFVQFYKTVNEETEKWVCEHEVIGGKKTSQHVNAMHQDDGKTTIVKAKYKSSCPFNELYHLGSRGATWIFDNQTKNIIHRAHALWKFENYFNIEKLWKIAFDKLLKALTEQNFKFTYMPKHDGSCVQVFYHNDDLHVYTLGSVNEHSMQQKLTKSPSFKQAAIKCLNTQYPELLSQIKIKNHTLICELITKYNRIVTHYDLDDMGFVKPIVTISNDGFPTWDLLSVTNNDEFKNGLPSESYVFNSLNYIEIKNKAYSELETKFNNPEGLVAYAYKKIDGNTIAIPIAKLKRDEYVHAHTGVIMNKGSEKELCFLQKMVIQEKIDDIDLMNNPIAKKHVGLFVKKLELFQKQIDELKDKIGFSNKDFFIGIKGFYPNLITMTLNLKKHNLSVYSKYDIKSWLNESNPISLKKYTFIESFQDKNTYWFMTDTELKDMDNEEVLEEKEITQLLDQLVNTIVFGCNVSTDIDIMVIVKNHENGEPLPLSFVQTNFIKKQLAECGYDIVNREIDIVLCCVDANGRVVAMSKGGKFTPNIIMETYQLHQQPKCHTPPKLVKNEINTIMIIESIRALINFVIQNDDMLTLKSHNKKIKKQMMEEDHDCYSLDVINKIANIESTNIEYCSVMKSFVMKLIQLCEMTNNKIHYTKEELANSYVFPDDKLKCGAMFWLMRGKKGQYNKDTIEYLVNQFSKIYKQYTLVENIYEYKKDNFGNPTKLPEELLDLFLKSPINPSEEFETKWNELTKGTHESLNNIFSTKADDKDITTKMYPNLPIDQFIFVDPKSKEWLDKLKYYTCGRNNGTLEKGFQGIYNLIRGSVVELLVSKVYKYSNWRVINTGIIVEKDEKKAKGFAPDMIFTDGMNIMAIEIKSLRCGDKDGSYRRELHLAMNQLYGAKEILGKYCVGGIIVFGWIENENLMTRIVEMKF